MSQEGQIGVILRKFQIYGLSSQHPDSRQKLTSPLHLHDNRFTCALYHFSWDPRKTKQKWKNVANLGYDSYLLATGHLDESQTKLIAALRHWPALWRAWIKYGLIVLPGSLCKRLLEGRRRFVREEN
jgi:hypothetical protein